MIMAGSNIQSAADQMVKIQEEYLYRQLVNPKPDIQAKVRQLRVAYRIDSKTYANLKRALPYVVCGIFSPPFRRTENFAYTEHFIIDIDHLASKNLALDEVRKRIIADERVLLCFASPSEDGLKVMFRLKERCYDAGLYSVFYKEFLKRFSEQYNLQQVADRSTSDVTRACFISIDPEAYHNVLCEPVDLKQYVNSDDTTQLFDTKHEQEAEEAKRKKEGAENGRESHPADPDKDVMAQIRQRLNPNARPQAEKPEAYVPQQLVEIIDELRKFIEDTGLVVSEVRSIQYGKKIHVKMGLKEAEVNVFFGKHGFSVVKSPKCGTHPELNDLVAEIVNNFLAMK